MKALVTLVCIVTALAMAQGAEAAAWKGQKVLAAIWNTDPRLPQDDWRFNASLVIVLEDAEGDTAEYHHRFNTQHPSHDFALSMYNTAKEARIHQEPLWLLIDEDYGIVAMALGEIDPSRTPTAVSRKGRISRSGASVRARGLFAGGSGPRDLLGRSLAYGRVFRPSSESAE